MRTVARISCVEQAVVDSQQEWSSSLGVGREEYPYGKKNSIL
jgi:hypothetical protein